MTTDGTKKLWISGIVVGALVGCGAPYIGLAFTVMGMVSAFVALGTQGTGDPTQLGAAIGEVLISTVVGAVMAVPGLVLMILSIVRLRKLERQTNAALGNAAP